MVQRYGVARPQNKNRASDPMKKKFKKFVLIWAAKSFRFGGTRDEADPTASRDRPFSRKRRLCAVCESITFFVRMDGVAVCPRHMGRRKKIAQPIRKDRDGEMRAS